MPKIRYRPSGFPVAAGSHLKAAQDIAVSLHELVWAAVTVGKPGIGHLLGHGWHSVADLIARTHQVYACLRSQSGRFVRSSLYKSMDPTEKAASSYFLGMLAAKILAARLLDVPWLWHVSLLRASGATISTKGRSEPDLVGMDTIGKWVVAEAKGRTHRFSSAAMAAAKKQTRQVRRINGNKPALRVAVQSYFDPDLEFAIRDPEQVEDDARDFEINLNLALRAYYSAAEAALHDATETVMLADEEYVIRSSDEVGVTIGMSRRVQAALREDQATADRLRTTIEPGRKSGAFTLFPDGIAIGLDERWSDTRIEMEPEQRSR